MLTSKQRARLAGIASQKDPLVRVGKSGADQDVAQALERELGVHELVKVRFIDFKGEKTELARTLAEATGSELIKVIGNVAVFFKQNPDPEKQKIKLD